MGKNDQLLARSKPRLSSRDRWIVACVALLALAAAASAFVSVLTVTLKFFGEQATPRESSVGNQSLLVVLWALVTPICCWAVLRGGRRAAVGATSWLALLALCRLWWWPSPPADAFEKEAEPLWQNQYGKFPWALLVVSLVIGLLAARRAPDRTARRLGAGVVLVVAGFVALSFTNVLRQAHSEEPTPLAEGAAELEALQQDPLWNALPLGSVTWADESPGKALGLGREIRDMAAREVRGLAR